MRASIREVEGAMIKDCSNLLQCESRLSQETQNISLLGQIALSPEDLEHLGTLIRQTVSPDISKGTRFLKQKAPTCLACFLVWMGIVGYRDGDYWSAVWESAGLAGDPNWERKWGKIFLAFLKANDLPLFDIEGGLTYVTPILTHGGIPNNCLDEFFEKILLPMVRRDLIDPTDSEEIIHELAVRREDDEERARVERQYDDLQRRTRSLAEKVRLARQITEMYDEVIELWRFEESTRNLDVLVNLPEDYEAFRNHKLADLSRLEEEIHSFEQKQTHCRHVVAGFTEQDKRVLARAGAIERSVSEYAALKEQRQMLTALKAEWGELVSRLGHQSARLFSETWSDEWGELLSQLSFDTLREEMERFEALASREGEKQSALNHLRTLSNTASRVRPILSVASLLLGLILIGISVQLPLSRALIVTGIGFTTVAGLTGWSWCRRRKSRRKQVEALKQTVEEIVRKQRRVRANISGILSDLPIAEQQLRSPSLELYQALISLADAYRELCEIRDHHALLRQEIYQQAQRAEQTAISIGVQPTRGLDETISAMERALKEARERQAVASVAKELEDNVRPKILELGVKRRALQEELARAEKRLAELGGGDIQAGIEQVKTQHQLQDTAAKLRTELKERYPDLETIEREIRNAQRTGNDKSVLEAEARQLIEQLEKIHAQADRVKQELAYYPTAFPGVDEPIRRYLLYGDKSAEKFLVSSVLLAHRSLTDEKVPNADGVDLPKRVVTAFERWWAQHLDELKEQVQSDERETGTGQSFRMPTISLDPAMPEILVYFHAQRYLASVGGMSACLELVGSISDSQHRSYPLRVYRSMEDLVETQELEFPLPFPADRYEFSLKSDSSVIHRWEVPAMSSDAPCMAFDWRSGRLIKAEELPKERVWFVSRDSSLEPVECILEKGSLHGRWKDYSFRALDLEAVDELQIVDDQGQRFLIPVSSEVLLALDLVGGQRLEGVHSQGAEIYVGSLPQVRVPIQDEAELRVWRLSIFPDEEDSLQARKHYRLSELQGALDVCADRGWVDVPLTDEILLGQRPVGRFTIRVRKPPYTDWRSTFCVAPNLHVEFDRDIYLPYETGKTPKVQAKILVAEHVDFAPQPPVELFETRDNLYTVRIGGAENRLRGILRLRSPDRRDQQIPLTISIPKVKWRLQGLSDDQYAIWHDTIEEVWLGDWETVSELFLVVELPPSVDGHLKLALGDDSGKEDEKKIHEGKARFDLLAFGDALQAGPSVQTFTLMHPESQFGIEHVPLFKVRTRWEAEDIECVQESQGRTIILNVTWTEKGRTGDKDRIVRVWSAPGVSSDPIIEQTVLEGTYVTLQANARALPPGEYLLQLMVEGPWSTTVVSRPAPNAPNTRVIEIVPIGDIRQGEVLSIRSIADDHGQLCQLDEGTYRIRIFGKIINRTLPTDAEAEPVLVTRTNEGWYVGNLETVADPGLKAEVEKANPVKLEYDASRDQITAIEDRYGEGAMYCRRCCKLYWSQEMNTEEEQKGHPLFGPVEVFKINWES
jgi:hypothetical protein